MYSHPQPPRRRWATAVRLAVLALIWFALPLSLLASAPTFPEAPPVDGRIAYTRMNQALQKYVIDVFSADANGDNESQITMTDDNKVYGSGAGEDAPRWSPDGEELVFSAAVRDQEVSIFRVPYTGGTPTPVVESDGKGGQPAWRPTRDRDCIAYSGAHAGGGDSTLDLKMWCDGDGITTVLDTDDLDESDPDWSPEGNSLAYVAREPVENVARPTNWHLRLHDLDAGTDEQLLELSGHSVRYPRWSPDGTQIAFVAGLPQGVGALMVFDVTTEQTSALVSVLGGDRIVASPPAWSPDGEQIIFYCTGMDGPWRDGDPEPEPPGPGEQRLGLYMIDVETRDIWRLKEAAGGSTAKVDSYEWGYSPDWTAGTDTPTPDATNTSTATATLTPTPVPPTPTVTPTATERTDFPIYLPIGYRSVDGDDEPSPTPDPSASAEPSPTP